MGWAHPYAHVALGLCLCAERIPYAHVALVLFGGWAHLSMHVVLGHANTQLSLGPACCKTQNSPGLLAVQSPK